MLKILTHESFDQTIKEGVVMVDFWADWCGPCKMLSPVVDEIAKEMSDVVVGKVNVDDYPELASKYNVMSIPTLLFFKNGKLVDTSIGVVSKNIMLKKIELIR